jgi:hypothetical protein
VRELFAHCHDHLRQLLQRMGLITHLLLEV